MAPGKVLTYETVLCLNNREQRVKKVRHGPNSLRSKDFTVRRPF